MSALRTITASAKFAVINRFASVPVWLWLLQVFVGTFFSIYFFAIMADYVDNPEVSVQYVVIGMAVQSIAVTTLYSVSEIPGTEKHVGTLPTLMTTPAGLQNIFLGMALFNIILGFVSAAVSLSYAYVFFDVDFSSTNVVCLLATVVLTALSLTGMGMAIGSLGIRLRTSAIIANVVTYLGLLLCGVSFPVSYLPESLQTVALCHPLTWAVEATRLSVAGESFGLIATPMIMMLVLGAIYAVFAMLMFAFFERSAKASGSLDSF